MYRLVVRDLVKRFGARKVFSDINFEVGQGESLAVVGPNGSGKTTLILSLLGLHRPSRGRVAFCEDEAPLETDAIRATSALVAPYLQLYGQLSAEENLRFFATMRGVNVTGKQINYLLARVGLEGRGNDPVAEYSSGMSQRLKYAAALLAEPGFLFLDEPMSNLDDQGKQVVLDIIEENRSRAVLVLATNEREEYGLAESQCRLGD